jgi:hypothetical protein
MKGLSAKAGVTIDQFRENINSGLKWCYVCTGWKLVNSFGNDSTRHDGKDPKCLDCRSMLSKARRATLPKKPRSRMGPLPSQERDGDKIQARRRVNLLVQRGKIPHPNTLPCSKCGHTGIDRRHEYHHHEGYGVGCHMKVIPLCTPCHAEEDRNWEDYSRNEKGLFCGRTN